MGLPACNLQAGTAKVAAIVPRAQRLHRGLSTDFHNMNGTTAFTSARRAARGAQSVLRTRYPLFLLGLPVPRGEIPVFIYHDVEPESFARELEFLRANQYRTISLDEFLAAGERKSHTREKRVLLTFDDARRSFYE